MAHPHQFIIEILEPIQRVSNPNGKATRRKGAGSLAGGILPRRVICTPAASYPVLYPYFAGFSSSPTDVGERLRRELWD